MRLIDKKVNPKMPLFQLNFDLFLNWLNNEGIFVQFLTIVDPESGIHAQIYLKLKAKYFSCSCLHILY